MSQAARVLIITSHVDGGAGALQAAFVFRGRDFFFVFFDNGEMAFGGVPSLKARGAEEDDRILNLFAAKTGERFLIFGEDAKDAAVGTTEEGFILIGQRCGFELIDHLETHAFKKLTYLKSSPI